ncbi:MAG: ferrous iron transport protein B [Planctomycetota bacterium]|jgi:ferrous iron transport protein B
MPVKTTPQNRIRFESSRKTESEKETAIQKVLLVGSPNVGKSMLFNRLTGRYVTVSNYPGTTIEVSIGHSKILGCKYEIIDTPGIYSLSTITAEEKVAADMVLNEKAAAVIHVIDSKNIERSLGLTLQLIEARLAVILVLNMADEARGLGIKINLDKLEDVLGIPVLETVATTGEGVKQLLGRIPHAKTAEKPRQLNYGSVIEKAISAIDEHLEEHTQISKRTKALQLLVDNTKFSDSSGNTTSAIDAGYLREVSGKCISQLEHSVNYHITVAVQDEVKKILRKIVKFPDKYLKTVREGLSRFCMHPLAGIPLLFIVLYFGIYKFVGGFGAGTVVDFLESTVFETYINPYIIGFCTKILPWKPLFDLVAGEYGVITLGMRYAIAIVLPIVGTFFIAFSILEDSGYLPRLAMLIDRVFKKIGLNGRAVIPIVLGFGCDTMATMVTRTLETKREKIIASILLALAIPCSAQLGVILGLLAGHPYALLAWVGFVGAIFLLSGTLMAKLFPGPKPSFYMELPPLRLPRPGNVIVKTYSRMVWYFKEILPLFILASVLIWAGQLTGVFQFLVKSLEPVVNAIGLPDKASVAFLFGFFRRDYGAAGLYDLQGEGLMTGNQLAVAAITLTLFLPCIAQFLIFKKECGTKISVITSLCICVIAFAVGFIANSFFNIFGIVL